MKQELYHSGVKGQKWGVRRYQNEDGTLTEEGKKRYRKGLTSAQKKKIAKTALTVAAVGAAAYFVGTENGRQILTEAGKKIKEKAESQETKDFVKKAGTKAIKSIEKSAERTGQAMLDAAMISVGGIAIAKISKKLDESATTEYEKDRNKVIKDTVTAGISTATKANKNTSGSSGGNNSNSAKFSSAVGQPSKKSIDKSSKEYQGLFKDSSGNQRDDATRNEIRAMASAGYDADQISEYLRKKDNGEIQHSAIGYYRVIRSA